MAIPKFKPGTAVTFTASAAVTDGQLVAAAGSYTAAPTSGSTAAWVGIASTDAATGQPFTVHSGGVLPVIVNSAVTVGQPVMAAANGRVVPFTGTDYSLLVGVALTPQATAGQTCDVKFSR